MDTQKSVATGIEMFRKLLDEAQAGDNVGVLLSGIEKNQVERGQVIAAPGSIKPHKKFKGQVYILNKEEGGRHTPFFTGYRPQFYFRTTDVTGVATASGRDGDGDARGQRSDGHRADNSDSDGEAAALRDPRRRPHGRCGSSDRDCRITNTSNQQSAISGQLKRQILVEY